MRIILICALSLLLIGPTWTSASASDPEIKKPMPWGGYARLAEKVRYPAVCDQARPCHEVVLRFRISVSGAVSHIVIEKSAGYEFDRAAVQAIQRTRWYPAEFNEQPVAVSFRQTFYFQAP